MKIYNYIEQTFFFTLTRKIFGNLSFVFLFQAITLFWLYQSLTLQQQSTGLFWLLTCVIVAGFTFTLFYMRFLIVRPVKAMRDTLININQQDANLAAKLPHFSYDEFKDLSTQYNTFTSHLSELLSTTYNSANASAQSNKHVTDSMQRTQHASEQQIHLSHSIINASNQITQSLQNIVSNTDSVHTVNNEHLNFVKLSAKELSTLVEQVKLITNMLGSFSNTVAGLKENSENIRSILKMVEDFSDQTNLLALNAAIEAARAGEHGRGFAVVADEVRTLASRTGKSTDEIQAMITKLQEGAKAAVEAVKSSQTLSVSTVDQASSANNSLNEIERLVSIITEMNSQIARATEQQTSAADEVNLRINDLSHSTEQSLNNTKQLTGASDKLKQSSSQLSSVVNRFKLD
jgi:methyl-accepting chemotaxis protein